MSTKNNGGEGQNGENIRMLMRLVALSVVEGKKQTDQVRLLALAGMDRHEIAELIGTTPLTVSVLISNMRKKGVMRGRKTGR